MWSVSPFPQVCHCHSQRVTTLQGCIRCHWYKSQVTVSYTRSNITQFQDCFLFKIPVLFRQQLSSFASPEYQTFFHRTLCIRDWPERIKALCWSRLSRLRQILLQETMWLAFSLTGSTLISSRRHRREGGSSFFGQMNSREMQNEGPFRDSRPLLNSFFLSFLQLLGCF